MLSAFAAYNAKPESRNKFKKRKLQQRKSKVEIKKPKVKLQNILGEPSELVKLVNKKDKRVKQKILKQKHIPKKTTIVNNVESPTLIPFKEVKCPEQSLKKRKTNIISQCNGLSSNSNKLMKVDSEVLRKPLDLLHYLLAPIKPSEFFNTYWETKPLHIIRNKQDYFKNILSSKQIDSMLRENLLYYTKNVDVVSYESGERQTHNPEGRALPANVWDYYMNGCSVRIMNPHTYNQKVRDLLSTLQEYFGTMVGVNVYLTPPGSQGFAPHYDDIEAFVIQLEGHKNWKIYSPRNNEEILPRYSSCNLPRSELQEPIKELTLKAGDLLYFPRGFIHEASTDSDAHSLHITVSVYQNTAYIDLLEKMLPQVLKNAYEHDVNYRKGLPLNYLKHIGIVNSEKRTSERKEIVRKVRELVHTLANYVSVDAAADQLGRKFMYEALPPHLASTERERSSKEDGDRMENGIVRNIVSFSPDTMVRFTRYYSQRLVVEESGVKMYYCTENANVYHGEEEQYLELDNSLIPTITELQNKYPLYVSIENLPGNDAVKKIQTISDLWERGLIITREPLDIDDE